MSDEQVRSVWRFSAYTSQTTNVGIDDRALMDRTDWKSLGYKGVGEDQDAQEVKDGVRVVKVTTAPREGQ